MASKYTSLQTRTAKLPVLLQKSLDIMRALKFIETKITSENGFVPDFFALRDEKDSIYDKPILFWGCT